MLSLIRPSLLLLLSFLLPSIAFDGYSRYMSEWVGALFRCFCQERFHSFGALIMHSHFLFLINVIKPLPHPLHTITHNLSTCHRQLLSLFSMILQKQLFNYYFNQFSLVPPRMLSVLLCCCDGNVCWQTGKIATAKIES